MLGFLFRFVVLLNLCLTLLLFGFVKIVFSSFLVCLCVVQLISCILDFLCGLRLPLFLLRGQFDGLLLSVCRILLSFLLNWLDGWVLGDFFIGLLNLLFMLFALCLGVLCLRFCRFCLKVGFLLCLLIALSFCSFFIDLCFLDLFFGFFFLLFGFLDLFLLLFRFYGGSLRFMFLLWIRLTLLILCMRSICLSVSLREAILIILYILLGIFLLLFSKFRIGFSLLLSFLIAF